MTAGVFGYATVLVQSQDNVQGARTCIPEQSACYATIACFTPPLSAANGGNGLGSPFTPNALRYRVDDVESGGNIVPWTGIKPADINQVMVPSFQNSILSFTRLFETHQILFQITDTNGGVFYARGLYDILRARGFVDNFAGTVTNTFNGRLGVN
jgi:hypothetical protein